MTKICERYICVSCRGYFFHGVVLGLVEIRHEMVKTVAGGRNHKNVP